MLKKLPSILLWIFVIAIQLQLVYLYTQPEDIVVDVEKVFNEFEMKKELQEKIKSIELTQKTVVDSLDVKLKQLENAYVSANDDDKKIIESQYQQLSAFRDNKVSKMQEELISAADNFDEQIWNQLNGYLSEYGKSQGVQIILGHYQNNVMYHSQKMDRTEEAISYVNNKYQGE